MVKEYQITGMTCSGCEAKVKSKLLSNPYVTAVEVFKETNRGIISTQKDISLLDFQNLLGGQDSKYQISPIPQTEITNQTKSWLEIYKPILLIFSYITIITLLIQNGNEHFNLMQWMQHFMAAFFLVFSFFKFLNIKGFAESYKMYDVLAKKIPIWAYFYAFIELGLGVSNLMNYMPLITNIITLVVMTISIIGVLQSVLNKKKIQCACLGAVFNLPMSTVTIIEDGLMIFMSLTMIYMMS